MDKMAISRVYIMTENEKEYIVQYNLITEPIKSYAYGVEIHMTSGNDVDSETCLGISDNLAYMLQFIELLARNYVMPVTLPYIVEDYVVYNGCIAS